MSFWKKSYQNAVTKSARVQGYKRTLCQHNHSHRSKLESALCGELHLMEKAGLLTVEQAEDHIYLSEAKICYIADFRVLDKELNEQVWYEAKGFENERWPIIKKLWAVYGPGRLRIYKGNYNNFKMVEEINPVGK